MTDDPMRVCVLFNGETTAEWVARTIEHAVAETNAMVSLLVINDEPDDSPRELLERARGSPHWARIEVGRLLLDTLIGEPAYRRQRPVEDIDGIDDDVPRVYCEPEPTHGFGVELPDDIVEDVGENADIVFREGFNVIKGDILTTVEHGVLSYHHGDPRTYRGGPPGFWEYLHREDTAGIMLQQLTEELDAGRIVVYEEVDIADASTWREVHRRQYGASVPLLATAIERYQESSFEPVVVESLGPVNTAPDWRSYLRYQYRNVVGRSHTARAVAGSSLRGFLGRLSRSATVQRFREP